MDAFSRRELREDEDFYVLLGCDETSTSEQISTEYKLLAKKYHPDKVSNPEEKHAAEKHFLLLQKAKEVLLDEAMRTKYNQWRADFSMWISFSDWMRIQSRVHTSIHWATKTQKLPSLQQGEGSTIGEKDGGSTDGVLTAKVSPLKQFRIGSQERTKLNQFRNYKL